MLKTLVERAVEAVMAPYRSVIFDTRFQPTVYPGDWIFHCGKMG